MNYNCPPDLPPGRDLTAAALNLFQGFRQEDDVARVATLLEEEITRHLRLCELAIMHAAAAGIYWARLPPHPLLDVDVEVNHRLSANGFTVEYRRVAREEDLPNAHNEKERIKAITTEAGHVAKWFSPSSPVEETTAAEWRRRTALEAEELSRTPPHRQSTGAGEDLAAGPALWAAIIDETFVIEVQSRFRRNFLCVFDAASGQCVHTEETDVSFGAM